MVIPFPNHIYSFFKKVVFRTYLTRRISLKNFNRLEGYDIKSLKYSMDMIRLKVDVQSQFVVRFFNRLALDRSLVKYYESLKFKDYRYNWIFTVDDVFDRNNSPTFWVGYKHNTEKVKGCFGDEGGEFSLVVEFNPNKVSLDGTLLKILIEFFASGCIVQSFDLAIDIPDNILNFIFDRESKHKYKIVGSGGDDKTFYFGSRNSNSSSYVKVYNKARELKEMQGIEIDGELTRYEITFNSKVSMRSIIKSFDFEMSTLPSIYKIGEVDTDDNVLRMMLYAVSTGFDINQLSSYYRNKFKHCMKDFKLIEKEKIVLCVQDYFKKLNDVFESYTFNDFD